MSITILTGLPGPGKSETLITRVRSALQEGRVVETIMCGDSSVLRARPGIAVRGTMGCRSGLSTRLNHFLSVDQSIKLLANAPPESPLAFDEAHYFGQGLVESWCAAADRGVEILIASPSAAQLKALNRRGHEASRLRLTCQICKEGDASEFFCHFDDDRTESVCDACFQRVKTETKAEIVRRLRRSPPNPVLVARARHRSRGQAAQRRGQPVASRRARCRSRGGVPATCLRRHQTHRSPPPASGRGQTP